MKTSQVQIVMPSHVNGTERLFGGQLMAWIDVVGAVEARRHCHAYVTTVCVDNLTFLAPAYLNETVRLDAEVTWTGNTSLEVRVESWAEPLAPGGRGGPERLINRAYLVYVASNKKGEPVKVPAFQPATDAEKTEWDAAVLRREQRLALKNRKKEK
jgi:acyl-CoA hydrolase